MSQQHTAVHVHDRASLAEVQPQIDAQQLDSTAPTEPVDAPGIEPPPGVPGWLTPEGFQQRLPVMVKWSAVPTAILGIVLVSIGAVHLKSACPGSKTLAAADIAWGASQLVGTLASVVQVLVLKLKQLTQAGRLLSYAMWGIWLWAVIAIFQDDLFSRVYVHGDAAACAPGLYNPSAIIMIIVLGIQGVALVVGCGFVCCVMMPAMFTAASRDVAAQRTAA